MAPLSRLDHVIIAVRNLDRAAATYRGLGFTLTPRGFHEGKGTGNHCIMFAGSYIELLGIVDERAAIGRLAERVSSSQGEGALGIAYGADDADATASALRAAGIAAEDPIDLARPLDLDGKREMVKFRNVMIPQAIPDITQFVCTHLTPDLTRARHEWQLHANGATGISGVTLETPDANAFRAHFETLAGAARVTIQSEGLRVAWDNCTFDIVPGPTTKITGLRLHVHEPDAAAAMLDMARVPNREIKNGVVVPATAAHGVSIAFAEN